METRMIQQVRIYKLILNGMDRAEDGRLVAVSTSYSRLVDYYWSQVAHEGYRDESGYYHTFIWGPLYWCNPCYCLDLNRLSPYGFGISDEWVDIEVFYNLQKSQSYKFVEE